MRGTKITASIMMNIIYQLGKTLLNSALYQVTQKEESTLASSQATTALVSWSFTHSWNNIRPQLAKIRLQIRNIPTTIVFPSIDNTTIPYATK